MDDETLRRKLFLRLSVKTPEDRALVAAELSEPVLASPRSSCSSRLWIDGGLGFSWP